MLLRGGNVDLVVFVGIIVEFDGMFGVVVGCGVCVGFGFGCDVFGC